MKVILYDGQLQKQLELLRTGDEMFSLNPITGTAPHHRNMGRYRYVTSTSLIVTARAAESELRPELESVGVDRFACSRSRSWIR